MIDPLSLQDCRGISIGRGQVNQVQVQVRVGWPCWQSVMLRADRGMDCRSAKSVVYVPLL